MGSLDQFQSVLASGSGRANPGHLIRRRGGSWAFDDDPDDSSDDEPGFKFGKHCIVPSAYIPFREHDCVLRTFVIEPVVDLD
ncbi:hypothetical protein [Hyphomicrobium sp. LHD-15]|uniref:hypothetical protein n=1 Tax=Hyphomicrobium sp. LHD-15 TaxID=3072142 RepID=UPI00280FE3E7|nr:hypothetical protein [Hyphomicrobium sp. LHD-15]MDQ8700680.1 hypothetical protein [Hyphomicrobium sp. LHD-15]